MAQFVWPANGKITSGFGNRNLNGLPNFHNGIDIGVPNRTPVTAAAAGTIIFEGLDIAGGNMIIIDHGNGYETYYEHLSAFTAPSHSHVTQGQQIGLSGGMIGEYGAGNSTGPHLHFGIKHGANYVDPLPILTGNGTITAGPAHKIGRADAGQATPQSLATAATQPSGFLGTGLGNPLNLLPGGKALGDITRFLTTSSNWKRLGEGLIGVAFLTFVIIRLLPDNMPLPIPV